MECGNTATPDEFNNREAQGAMPRCGSGSGVTRLYACFQVTVIRLITQTTSMLLEHPAGPYLVGATTFALPVRPSDVIGTAAVRTETGQITPALRLEEVSFTAYYPASPTTARSRWKWLDWLPRYVLHRSGVEESRSLSFVRPLAETVRGYSRFAGELAALVNWHFD